MKDLRDECKNFECNDINNNVIDLLCGAENFIRSNSIITIIFNGGNNILLQYKDNEDAICNHKRFLDINKRWEKHMKEWRKFHEILDDI